MRRPVQAEVDLQGQDSFLDIVANMVGILIILVMVVGVRAGRAPLAASTAPSAAAQQKLAALQAETQSLEGDVRALHSQSKQLKMQLALRDAERQRLATFIAAVEDEIKSRNEKMAQNQQEDFALRRALAEARLQLQRTLDEKLAATVVESQRVTVLNLPTPISKTVHGREMHFQLRGGRITFIPLDNLLEEFQATARHKLWKLKDRNETSDIVGPMGGFRLRYHLAKIEVRPETLHDGPGGSIVQLVKWELLPVSSELGETVTDALLPDSQFRRVIAGFNSRHTTLTIWTYPDSFDDFRRLKAELFSLGFATAGRPLPEGETIGGSPLGTKSAAQ